VQQRSRPLAEAARFLGGYAEGVTPVPIPNTEVKPLRVDGTAWVAMWESRSPPGILFKTPQHLCAGAFLRPETKYFIAPEILQDNRQDLS
jgi:hypothetical protein